MKVYIIYGEGLFSRVLPRLRGIKPETDALKEQAPRSAFAARLLVSFVLLSGIWLFSCQSKPLVADNSPQATATPPLPPAPVAAPIAAPIAAPVEKEPEIFDPASVTQEEYNAVKTDIQAFIANLNRVIKRKDYKDWVAYLGTAYFDRISSPEFLNAISRSSPRLQSRNIVLKSAEEYFLEVVVPSRANDHVDDIAFVTHTRIKAYTINARKERLRLYDLEYTGNGWKIIN
jgi:hypothetical protein